MTIAPTNAVAADATPATKPRVVRTPVGRFLNDCLFSPPTAAMIAGLGEVALFHPVDTVSKRLMSHEHRVIVGGVANSMRNVGFVVRQGQPYTGAWSTIQHLYRGLSYAVLYKVSQRVIKFAGQPLLKDYFHQHHRATFEGTFGKTTGKQVMEATAGAAVGVMEVSVLPFDRMKVLLQTNKEALRSRGLLRVARDEGIRKLYAGAATTAVRNVPGSFLLFGGTAFVKDCIFALEDHRSATTFQNMVASTVGACMGVFCTSPIDVVKTRLQNKSFSSQRLTGRQVFVQVVRSEGVSAFFKGITPKVLTTSPKLVFTYTASQFLIGSFSRLKEDG